MNTLGIIICREIYLLMMHITNSKGIYNIHPLLQINLIYGYSIYSMKCRKACIIIHARQFFTKINPPISTILYNQSWIFKSFFDATATHKIAIFKQCGHRWFGKHLRNTHRLGGRSQSAIPVILQCFPRRFWKMI